MSGQGSGGNVLAALASLFIPGLGQLLQGRVVVGFLAFVVSAFMWLFLLGWIINIVAAIDAAKWTPRAQTI
jgi:TM2 domain-containing membrane protein YozV